jgi:hypothetical protein
MAPGALKSVVGRRPGEAETVIDGRIFSDPDRKAACLTSPVRCMRRITLTCASPSPLMKTRASVTPQDSAF